MKTALITGASGGIGLATVEKFIENGYFVIAQYNTGKEKLDKLKSELEKTGKGDYLFCVKADFKDTNGVKNLISETERSFKHIDVLINNAGTELYKLITETTEREWEELFNVNVKAVFELTNFALKSMIERKSGKIVNVSSVWGITGASMEVAYSASKSALIGYTKALAKEAGPSNVNVNCVCPGVIDTKMNARFSPEEIKELIDSTPLGRLGKPKDVADLIYFLSSENASFITGGIFTADGGFSL